MALEVARSIPRRRELKGTDQDRTKCSHLGGRKVYPEEKGTESVGAVVPVLCDSLDNVARSIPRRRELKAFGLTIPQVAALGVARSIPRRRELKGALRKEIL